MTFNDGVQSNRYIVVLLFNYFLELVNFQQNLQNIILCKKFAYLNLAKMLLMTKGVFFSPLRDFQSRVFSPQCADMFVYLLVFKKGSSVNLYDIING